MNKSIVLLGLAAALGWSSAQARINALDAVPAATLLLPHFEVDPSSPSGVRTVFTVGNTSPGSTLAHVTLWTDRGVPTLTFDVRIDGFGVVEVDLHSLFANGVFPQTSAGSFPSCVGQLPPANLTAGQITGLRNAHTGQASSLLGNQCGGTNHGDAVARGYATIDVVNACTTLRPGQSGYFVLGGNGVARNSNQLWGEHSTYAPGEGFAHGDTLVHIEASASNDATNGAGDYTFYGRLVGGTGADNREALPQHWMGRFASGGLIDQTLTTVWRDPGLRTPFFCATPPAGMTSGVIVAFNQQEQPALDQAAFPVPLASQRKDVKPRVPFDDGFVQYDLRIIGSDPLFGGRNQGHVSQVFRSRYGGSAGQAGAWPLWPITMDFTPSASFPDCSDGVDNDGDGLIDFPDDPGCGYAGAPSERPACSDGIDNDADTLVDFPTDPQCGTPTDNTEDFLSACDDGIDNDGDGLIDYPADPGCGHPNEATEFFGACDDGIDNDGDGLIDFPADPGCASRTGFTESPACSDGVDNDLDAHIDFPADPSCGSAAGFTETTQCSDGDDDDADGLIDFPNDPGCSGFTDTSELDFECSDGVDNDGSGLVDFPLDPGCTTAQDDFEEPDCSDGTDNDRDGTIDFGGDPGCASATDYNELANTTTRACSDGIDNDGDGLTDYPNDPGCQGAWGDVEFGSTIAIFGDGFEAQPDP